jgi:hypothetical protein
MTEEQIALARRAVACKGWRWMPGMKYIHRHDIGPDVWSPRIGRHGEKPVRAKIRKDVLPMFDDPATMGCLLALVREVWGDEVMTCARVDVFDDYIAPLPGGYPYNVLREGRRRVFKCFFASEAEALVVALEAAP